MNIGFVETDFQKNVKRISPLLGLLLVAAFAFFLYQVMSSALGELTQAVHTEAPTSVAGTLRLVNTGTIKYKDMVSFKSTVHGAANDATSYVTVTCFQGTKLVYQRSAQQGVSFLLSDQYERDLEWDGNPASCSATLVYRMVGTQVDVYILDALSFEVGAKSL